jgi:ribosomal protein L37E
MGMVAAFLLGVAICSLLVSWFLINRHKVLAKIALETPIYIHPVTKIILKDTASRATLSSERFLNGGYISFFLALCAFIAAIPYSFDAPLAWPIKLTLKVISLGWFPGLLLCFIVGLSAIFFGYIVYDLYFNRIAKVEAELRINRKRYCSFCENPFNKYVIKATDFLNDSEIANYQAGTIQCSINTELCSTCSFPLTRKTLNLRLSLIRRDESIECPKCKNYTFTCIEVGDPVRAKQIGEAGYKTFERQCHYCGYQVQRQPRITLSSVEPAIKSAIDSQDAWERYCDRLNNEIEQMIQCDEVGKDCSMERYELVDATYFRGDGTPSLRELKYLSTDDRKKAIKFIHKYVQERHAWESDPRNSDAGPE